MVVNCHSKSEIKVTHLPTGNTFSASFFRSQHKNKDLAIRVIKARLQADRLGLKRPEIVEDVSDTVCPICELGLLEERFETLRMEILGEEFDVPSLYYVCTHCQSEQMNDFLLKKNIGFTQAARDFAVSIKSK
ncbi:peptide chain release factor family protein [Aeromonas veronii]|uniref:Uncharacterized protein n=1 Tax=Aeromonas veronii TaxID=654 RepID=A0A2T4MWE6_AERVE|nr:peptide chain release factor-like protein [Aeromonas veronii]PTH78884.1 hypothetical protein DAA48_20800 [Aeromonas veronii]